MARVLECCAAGGPQPAAHPSYPDRDGFGRRTLTLPPAALAAAITSQCTALAALARAVGLPIRIVKPHGALYHDANASLDLAKLVIDSARSALEDSLIAIGPPSGALADAARAAGVEFWREGFADRRRRADGSLVPRTDPNALIANPVEAAAQALELAGQVDIIATHGDTPGALAIARAVRTALRGGGMRTVRGSDVGP